MPFAKITGQGLVSIAILVALLWACAIGERVVVSRANGAATEAMEAMRLLRIRTKQSPVSSPPARRARPRASTAA